MRYFEFDEPYYALIRAKDELRASQFYLGISGLMIQSSNEKTRHEALNLFLRHEDTKGEKDFGEMIREFNHDSEAILLVDRGLI